MKKPKLNYKVISIVLLCLIAAAAVCAAVFIKPAYRPSFTLTGDVEHTLSIDSMDGYNTYTALRDGTSFKSLKLSELVEKAVPYSKSSTLVIRGDDGLLAQVDVSKLDGMYIACTAQNGWEMINGYHPPSSNIKRIKEIWVVSSEQVPGKSVSIISQDEDIAVYSPGQLFMSQTLFEPVFHGTSKNSTEAGEFSVSVYTEKRYKNVADIAPDAQSVLVMGEEGAYGFDTSPGKIALLGNKLQYVYSDGRKTMEHVRGILINPPSASNMDAYHEAANNISAGNRVLVVLVDGFGYHMYEHAVREGCAPFIASLEPAVPATSEYRPVTNTGTAAILTGQPPCVNGIYDRHMSELKSPDIFEYVTGEGRTAACIEGNVMILKTSVDPKLNADRNGDDSTDEEVYESAAQALSEGVDYVFVHFHGVDDYGHTYGDIDTKTMDKIREVDSYIASLAAEFNGTLIITADHGMHSEQDGGSHGVFRNHDMIVPYISQYMG